MKNLQIIIASILGIAIIAGSYSCKSDEDNDFQSYNLGKIYMPQAVVISNEVNYNYEIPAPIGSEEIRYTLDENSNTLKIKLGVKHDGADALAYEVAVTPDIANSELFAATLTNGIALDSKYYILPSKVNVDEGHKETEFSLDIDLNKLTTDYSRNVDIQFVLSIRISESSEYEINSDRNHVIVIIDGRTFIEESKDVLIYMSKAGKYHVPLEDNTINYTFTEADLSLKVPLNIERNNIEPYDGFSVSVVADEDYANTQASSIANSVVIPAEYYTLPPDVAFGNNEFSKSFDVAVDFKRLSIEKPELKNKKLLIGMKLANPTSSYIIDEERYQTVLIIDAQKFYYVEEVDPSNMLRGAKFNFGDIIHWVAVNSDGGAGAGTGLKPQMASIRDGFLKFTITGRCYHSFYQAVEVTTPGKYKISFEYNHNPASTGVDGRTFIYFSQKKPQTDVTFYNSADSNCASISDAASINPVANNISLSSNTFYKPTSKGWDSAGEGILNITTTGTYYFVIGVDIWTAGQGFNATYDNIRLEKVD